MIITFIKKGKEIGKLSWNEKTQSIDVSKDFPVIILENLNNVGIYTRGLEGKDLKFSDGLEFLENLPFFFSDYYLSAKRS